MTEITFPPGRAASVPAPEDRRTPAQAAEFLGVSKDTLRNWRHQRRGPPFYAISRNLIVYAEADLVQWLHNRRVRPRW